MTQADFLSAAFPEPQDIALDITSDARFVNRELSWLGFNNRVLEEAENPRVPLLERLIDVSARALMARQQKVFRLLMDAMADEDMHLLSRDAVNSDDLAFLNEFFLDQVFPVLSPLAIDPAHPFPFSAICRLRSCCSSTSTDFSPATSSRATALSACSATAILRSKMKPKTSCVNLKPP